MNRDKILELAQEVGLTDKDLGLGMTDYGNATEELIVFAEMVVAAEREACAQVCDDIDPVCYDTAGHAAYAAAIRARGTLLATTPPIYLAK